MTVIGVLSCPIFFSHASMTWRYYLLALFGRQVYLLRQRCSRNHCRISKPQVCIYSCTAASAGRPIAPLRTSDRRKLRQRVVQTYGVSSELGDLLVPDGLMSQKVATYADDPGVSIHVTSRLKRTHRCSSCARLGRLFVIRGRSTLVHNRKGCRRSYPYRYHSFLTLRLAY